MSGSVASRAVVSYVLPSGSSLQEPYACTFDDAAHLRMHIVTQSTSRMYDALSYSISHSHIAVVSGLLWNVRALLHMRFPYKPACAVVDTRGNCTCMLFSITIAPWVGIRVITVEQVRAAVKLENLKSIFDVYQLDVVGPLNSCALHGVLLCAELLAEPVRSTARPELLLCM